MREIISKVQTMRKEAGFEVMDHIVISYHGTAKLDEIAKTLYEQGCASDRFLFSEKEEENSKKNAES